MRDYSAFKEAVEAFVYDFGVLPDFTSPYPAPTVFPRAGHPRVWVNADTVERVRINSSHPENKNNYDKVFLKANKDTDGKLPPRADSRHNFTYDSISDIESMAYMYLVTKDKYYGYKAIMCAENWLSTIDFPEPKNDLEIYNFGNLAGYSMHVMAEVYDWCYDLLDGKGKKLIAVGTANKLGLRFEIAYPPTALGGVTGHGLCAEMLRDWLSFSLAAYDEFPEFYMNVLGRILAEYIEAPNYYYASGANFQGSAYGINKTYLHMISEILMGIGTGVKIYNTDVSFEATAATYMHYHRPDNESLRLGDDYNQRELPYRLYDQIRIAFFGGVYYKNAALKSWSAAMSDNFNKLDWWGRCEINPVVFLVMNDTELETSEMAQFSLPLVNYNGSPYGAITARSKWNDKNAWMTYCKIGELYGANHDHKDAGTFQIYYKGILAQTSACYEYMGREQYGSELDCGYNKQTISKNGILVYNHNYPEPADKWEARWINSGGQRFRGAANQENKSLTEWLSKSTSRQAKELAHDWKYADDGRLLYSYIAGDISNAYDDITVKSLTRHMISIATDCDGHPLVFVTYDRVCSVDKSFKKTYLLHTPAEPAVIGNVITFTNKGDSIRPEINNLPEDNNGRLTSTVLLPASVNINVIGGDGKRFFVDGRNLADEWREGEKINRQETGWGRVEISPSSESLSDTFLNVMYVGDADDNIYIRPEKISSATHDGALIFGKAVLFARSDRSGSFDVEFELSSQADCIVTGLDAGEWQICLDGEEIAKGSVTKEAQLAYFKSAPGKITLKKLS